jgi:hypothetical protein
MDELRFWRIWVQDARIQPWSSDQVRHRFSSTLRSRRVCIDCGPMAVFDKTGTRAGEWSFDLTDLAGRPAGDFHAVLSSALVDVSFRLRKRPQALRTVRGKPVPQDPHRVR